MNNNNIEWSNANQQYLATKIRLLKERLVFIARNRATHKEQEEWPDFSGAENELAALAASMTAPPAIEKLTLVFGLSSFERDILLLCAGMELDPGISDAIASIQGDAGLYQPTFGLALATLPEAHWSAIAPGSPLRYWRMIEVNKAAMITRSALKTDEHILHFLAGLHHFNERLDEIAEPVYAEAEPVPSQLKTAEKILATIRQKTTDNILPVIQFFGTDRTDKLMIAATVSSSLQSSLYSITAYAIPAGSREATELARLWSREAALNNYVLFLDCTNLDISDKQRVQVLINFIESIKGLVILSGDQWTPELKRHKVAFDIEKPAPAEQLLLWEQIIGPAANIADAGLGAVVSQFNLSTNTIRKAGYELFSQLNANGKKQEQDKDHVHKKLWKLCCRFTRPYVDELAQRIEPVATWNDIVLPDMQKKTLREMAAQVKQRNKVYGEWGFASKGSRGLGISALFAGESGTGKTMASEVLANELGLDLYKIDLSKVVNKYIGETEKNLKRIFDAAEEGGAILLFDEADALFGKRSDVKDSHDRYSNIEVSYLLQRMEAYRGLAILTTNMKNAVDKAFMRRLRFVIQFPFPDSVQRAEIWSKVFPDKTPKEELDLEKLSRLSIAGGSIRNIAMNAAFYAADENKPVQMGHIFRAAKSEYEKTEKPFNTAELKAW